MTYSVALPRQAKNALSRDLPEGVAAAVAEFIYGPLADNPHRVGTRLRPPKADTYSARRGTYRVLYRILSDHIYVAEIHHRRDSYR